MHIIFPTAPSIRSFGRNLDVAEDDDIGKLEEEDAGDIVPGLQCKIVVRFEEYREFCNALKVLSGRSLQKVGSFLHMNVSVSLPLSFTHAHTHLLTHNNHTRLKHFASSPFGYLYWKTLGRYLVDCGYFYNELL